MCLLIVLYQPPVYTFKGAPVFLRPSIFLLQCMDLALGCCHEALTTPDCGDSLLMVSYWPEYAAAWLSYGCSQSGDP
jgi:hypothetical protein